MLCTGRYCTCPGLCRNEEMEDVQYINLPLQIFCDGFQIRVMFKPLKYCLHTLYLCTFFFNFNFLILVIEYIMGM